MISQPTLPLPHFRSKNRETPKPHSTNNSSKKILTLLRKSLLAITSSKFEPHYQHTYRNSHKLQAPNSLKRALALEGGSTFFAYLLTLFHFLSNTFFLNDVFLFITNINLYHYIKTTNFIKTLIYWFPPPPYLFKCYPYHPHAPLLLLPLSLWLIVWSRNI